MNLRANWELVFIQWLQVLIVSILLLAGALPPLAVLGWTDWEVIEASVRDWPTLQSTATDLIARGQEAWLLLAASLVAASAIWLMAMLVYCYFQGGILAVLVAADRQAPARRPWRWPGFRTFNTRDLRGWAGRYLWRYFWLFNLFLLISLLWVALVLLLVVLALWGEARWGPSAALGIGCGGSLPVAFCLLVLVLWISLSQADLARERSGVRIAIGRALRILGHRLGTLLLLAFLALVAALSLGIVIAALSTVMQILTRTSVIARLGGQLSLSLVEWAASSALSVALAAILVALVRSEPLTEVTA